MKILLDGPSHTARDVEELVLLRLCPDPGHSGPCPIPWSADLRTDDPEPDRAELRIGVHTDPDRAHDLVHELRTLLRRRDAVVDVELVTDVDDRYPELAKRAEHEDG